MTLIRTDYGDSQKDPPQLKPTDFQGKKFGVTILKASKNQNLSDVVSFLKINCLLTAFQLVSAVVGTGRQHGQY